LTDTLAFLRHILPQDGYYCAVSIVNNQWRHEFFSSIEKMAEHIVREDAFGDREVYHACSTFKVPKMDPKGTPPKDRVLGRTRHNAIWAKALWLDLDCGEGKDYESQEHAYRAVESFRSSVGLPRPLYVSSGYGLHTYWPLAKGVAKETWKESAERLRNLCEIHQLTIDESRTCDPASILRPVGTSNRKRNGCRPV